MLHKLDICDTLLAVRDYFCTNNGKIVQEFYHLNTIFKVQRILKKDLSIMPSGETPLCCSSCIFPCIRKNSRWSLKPAGKVFQVQIQLKGCSHGLIVCLKSFSRGVMSFVDISSSSMTVRLICGNFSLKQ